MRVFLTGATGFVGSAVLQELIAAKHDVLALARSDSAAEQVSRAGAEAYRGSLDDLNALREAAAASDAVIHTAFLHDRARFDEAFDVDRRAIEALGAAVVGSERPLIVTSAIGILPHGQLVTEETSPPSGAAAHPRAATEEVAGVLAARGACVLVIRLPPSVHGDGDHGFVPILIGLARDKGVSAYVDEGRNRWPAAHRIDVATLYRLVLEKGKAGAIYHGVAEEGIALREIAEVIGRRLDVPVVTKSGDEAAQHFDWVAYFAAMDVPAASRRTRDELGWQPMRAGLLADIDRPAYFA